MQRKELNTSPTRTTSKVHNYLKDVFSAQTGISANPMIASDKQANLDRELDQ